MLGPALRKLFSRGAGAQDLPCTPCHTSLAPAQPVLVLCLPTTEAGLGLPHLGIPTLSSPYGSLMEEEIGMLGLIAVLQQRRSLEQLKLNMGNKK